MRIDDFEQPGLCQLCWKDLASVYVVISRAMFTAKAHVCFACFRELEECGGRWVQPVSLQEFKETVETDNSSEECGVLHGPGEQSLKSETIGKS